jgi:nitroimidazol reductase NimA-like FMN-containing flavoprotein (pyridoxamine 5'-phosphate oxidase superfamily)
VHRDDDPFDVEAFLARPLTARLATVGPSVRPVWYLWEDFAFWILTGSWSRIPSQIKRDARVAIVIDTCDLRTGEVLRVVANGSAELLPYDTERGFRKLSRYLGNQETTWDDRFQRYLREVNEARWLRLSPTRLVATDLSFRSSSSERGDI